MSARLSVPIKPYALDEFHRWLALAGTLAGWLSGIPSFILPLSCVPSLHGRYPLRRYYGRSDSRQPDARTVCPTHPPALAGLPDYCRPTSVHSVSKHQRVDRGLPGCQRVYPAVTGFVIMEQTRPTTPTESSSRRRFIRTTCVTDWSFSFRCSPPRIAATQLRFDTARFFTAQKRTSTAPSSCLFRRTPSSLRDETNLVGVTRHFVSG
jgi:hypothetical protein